MSSSNEIKDYYYKPSDSLTDDLTEILQFYSIKSKKDKVGDKLSPSEKKLRTKVNTTKTRLLDNIIFPSLANLVYFLEFINKSYPILEPVFEKDLNELFGITQLHIEKQKRDKDSDLYPTDRSSFIFGRLIEASINRSIISYQLWRMKQKGRNTYRILLLESMQKIIAEIVSNELSSYTYSIFDTIDDYKPKELTGDMLQLIGTDMNRAYTWTKFFSNIVKERLEEELNDIYSNKKQIHRPVSF